MTPGVIFDSRRTVDFEVRNLGLYEIAPEREATETCLDATHASNNYRHYKIPTKCKLCLFMSFHKSLLRAFYV